MDVYIVMLLIIASILMFFILCSIFIFLLVRKFIYNFKQLKKRRYFEAIHSRLILYISGQPLSIYRLLQLNKQWKKDVIIEILFQAATSFSGEEEFRRINEISEQIGLTADLRTKIQDKRWWIATDATRKAGKLRLVALQSIIAVNLYSRHFDLRMGSARALTHMNEYGVLVSFLVKNEAHLTKNSIIRLADMLKKIPKNDLQFLIERIDKVSPLIQGLTLEIIGKSKANFALPHVEKFLESEQLDLRLKAMKAIGEIGLTTEHEKILSLLTHEQWIIKVNAILIVKNCNLQEAMKELELLITDANWWVRYRAAEALYSFGEKGIQILEKISSFHEDMYAKDMAIRILLDKSIGVA